jgi:hypothetical protein
MNINLRCDTGKVVAHFDDENKTLIRRLRGSKHLLRSPQAICFDASIIEQAQYLGCQSIEVKDIETNIVYRVQFTDFKEKAISINRGFGSQLALPLTYWASSGGKPWNVTPIPVRQMALEVENPQLALFEITS